MDLPGRQDELVAAVAAVNPRTVVVLNCGSPVTMPWLDRSRPCCRSGFPVGQVGSALVDVLSGDVEPGGRLPVTFPRALDRTPAAPFYPGDGVRSVYGEGLLVGYRWYHHAGVEPLFPFGHGLGYTTFDIVPVGLSGSPAAGVYVAADVVNTGRATRCRPSCRSTSTTRAAISRCPDPPLRRRQEAVLDAGEGDRHDRGDGADVLVVARRWLAGGEGPPPHPGRELVALTGRGGNDVADAYPSVRSNRLTTTSPPHTGWGEPWLTAASRSGRGRPRRARRWCGRTAWSRRTRCAPTAATGAPTR